MKRLAVNLFAVLVAVIWLTPGGNAPTRMVAAESATARPRERRGERIAVPAGDPTLFFADGHYYVFSSGPGLPFYRSSDLVTWQFEGNGPVVEPGHDALQPRSPPRRGSASDRRCLHRLARWLLTPVRVL